MAVRAAFRCQTCKNPLEFEGVPEALDSRAGASLNAASAAPSHAPFGDSDDAASHAHARQPTVRTREARRCALH